MKLSIILSPVLLSCGLLSSLAMADYLALIETVVQRGANQMGGQCHDGDPSYTISSFASHPGFIGTECTNRYMGRQVAHKPGFGDDPIGCKSGDGWSDGYRVCKTSYGVNIHKDGRHQRCPEDNNTLYMCPNVYCWTRSVRKFKCEGVWHRDT